MTDSERLEVLATALERDLLRRGGSDAGACRRAARVLALLDAPGAMDRLFCGCALAYMHGCGCPHDNADLKALREVLR